MYQKANRVSFKVIFSLLAFLGGVMPLCAQDLDLEFAPKSAVQFQFLQGEGPVLAECRLDSHGQLGCRTLNVLIGADCFLDDAATENLSSVHAKIKRTAFVCPVVPSVTKAYSFSWRVRLVGADRKISEWWIHAASSDQYVSATDAEKEYRKGLSSSFDVVSVGVAGGFSQRLGAAYVVGSSDVDFSGNSLFWGRRSLEGSARYLLHSPGVEYGAGFSFFPFVGESWRFGGRLGAGISWETRAPNFFWRGGLGLRTYFAPLKYFEYSFDLLWPQVRSLSSNYLFKIR